MDTIRYVDTNWHHYCKRAQLDSTTTFTNFTQYKNAKGKKYSYIQDFGLEDIEKLENKIKIPITSSNHALAWHCLRLAGIDDNFPNLGKLYKCNLNKK